jgi:hypothetical protein
MTARRTRISAAIGAASIAAVALAACGSGPPDPTTTATNACQELATATSITNLANPDGFVPGQTGNFRTLAQAVTDIQKEEADLPQPLSGDVQPLLAITGVTQAQVAKVSQDCTAYGVAAAIWPQFLTSP